MKVIHSEILPDIIIIEPNVFTDNRGRFLETYQAKRYLEFSIPDRFVQDNASYSTKGVLRGLHYQIKQPQGKLVWAVQGEIFDVAVDIRRGSPTFGKWEGVHLSSTSHKQVYIPEGFAHGFCVISDEAIINYKCTGNYAPKEERGILWDDPVIAIDWPVKDPILSSKDSTYPTLATVNQIDLPAYKGNP